MSLAKNDETGEDSGVFSFFRNWLDLKRMEVVYLSPTMIFRCLKLHKKTILRINQQLRTKQKYNNCQEIYWRISLRNKKGHDRALYVLFISLHIYLNTCKELIILTQTEVGVLHLKRTNIHQNYFKNTYKGQ